MSILNSLYRSIAFESQKKDAILNDRLEDDAPPLLHNATMDSEMENKGSWGMGSTVKANIWSLLTIEVDRLASDFTSSEDIVVLALW
jgi:hypothetical protein